MPHQNLSDCKLVSRWPVEWEHRYEARQYIHIDPVISYIRGTSDPFSWQEAAATGQANGHVVMEEARAFGLNHGLCVPFHQFDGREGGVSFGGERFNPSHDERAALHLIAIYAMSSAKGIAKKRTADDKDADSKNPLSAREIECLKWTAVGKTAWEISVILSLSQRTVEQYLTKAASKLEAVSRVHCVAEAFRRRIIQ